ncbi:MULTISPECIES: tetratricopeptide repeat protein [unclassified Sphingobium]|uniref:tetratricopeptide repeat protein n=1 Tax=unclassified Sphingobium TaxID=2611147 RepID=UPI000971554C|nr:MULTISPECIES: tetratricopeptide repeat protein [unclassified Sphingobium]
MKLRVSLRKLKVRDIARGDRARDRRDWEAAAAAYHRGLKQNPHLAPIWVQYGHALKELGQLGDAEAAYRKAVALRPDDADARLHLGHIFKSNGNSERAAITYLDAFKLDPDNRHVNFELKMLGLDVVARTEMLRVQDRALTHVVTRLEQNHQVAGEKDASFFDRYRSRFADVRQLEELGIIHSAEQHYRHYGYRQGREILATLAETRPSRAIVVCPSFFKRCGIGEHARYLADSIEKSGLETLRLRTTQEVALLDASILKDAVVVVNHGPGLFDGYNPELSEGEATSDMVSCLLSLFATHNCRPIIFMHSLLDVDNTVMFPRQQFLMESPIPIATTIEAAAKTFNIARVEHGMQPIASAAVNNGTPAGEQLFSRDYPTIGFFGFFQFGGKNFDALLTLAERVKGKLVGSVAGSPHDIAKLEELLTERTIRCNIGTGWVDDSELAIRLSEADYHYLPQYDYDHWNNSGTARFAMNFGKPVILPPHNPFLDLRQWALFADEHDLPAIIAHLRDDKKYDAACQRSIRYGHDHPMTREMVRLVTDLDEIQAEDGLAQLISANTFCALSLARCPFAAFVSRVRYRTGTIISFEESSARSPERFRQIAKLRQQYPGLFEQTYSSVPKIEYWRDHYELSDFLFPTAYEAFLNAYRSILKRDPDLYDGIYVSNLWKMNVHALESPSRTDQISVLITSLLRQKNVLPFAPAIQIYDAGEPVIFDAKTAADIGNRLSKFWEEESEGIPLLGTSGHRGHGYVEDLNIFSVLSLPTHLFESSLGNIFPTVSNVSEISKDVSAQARYASIINKLGIANIRISDYCLLDHPIVGHVNFERTLYCLSDFWQLSGNEFLFTATRSLLKRDPTALEVFYFERLYEEGGRRAVLRALLALPQVHCQIVDINDELEVERLEKNQPELTVMHEQFRSPVAGGWDLRNRYLEERRNYGRAWLAMHEKKEKIWTQSNGKMQAILFLSSED